MKTLLMIIGLELCVNNKLKALHLETNTSMTGLAIVL